MIPWWESDRIASRVARAGLYPLALVYRAAVGSRRATYRRGWRRRAALPLPSVGIGSLQVGGAGKTPIAAWTARWFSDRGARPAVLLRGYGGDEGPLHRQLVPTGIVVEDPDRRRGAARAVAQGADALVLDDAFQHLGVRPDLQLVLISAEAFAAGLRLLPAGPWREPPVAAAEADIVVITRKTASDVAVHQACAAMRRTAPHVPQAVARLAIGALRTHNGDPIAGGIPGTAPRVLVLSGIANPRSFVGQVRRVADVRAMRLLRDHVSYPPRRVTRIVRCAETAKVDYVVTTAKDAVKLRTVWPRSAPPLVVADLVVEWERGVAAVARTLEACWRRRAPRTSPRARTESASPVLGANIG